jgi:putative transposase
MTRIRDEAPDRIHHVFARGVNRNLLFLDDEDYRRYVRLLRGAVQRYGWRCLAFCLMPNHVHLLIRTPEPNLGAGMQWLQSRYALSFNERHGRLGEGHVFQGPYGSNPVDTDVELLRVAAYVVMNPVVGGLCASPEQWQWSDLGMLARGLSLPWAAHEELAELLTELTGRRDFLKTIVL